MGKIFISKSSNRIIWDSIIPIKEADLAYKEAKRTGLMFLDWGVKGHMKVADNPTAREELRKKYDRTTGIDTYALGSLGSTWGVLKVIFS